MPWLIEQKSRIGELPLLSDDPQSRVETFDPEGRELIPGNLTGLFLPDRRKVLSYFLFTQFAFRRKVEVIVMPEQIDMSSTHQQLPLEPDAERQIPPDRLPMKRVKELGVLILRSSGSAALPFEHGFCRLGTDRGKMQIA